MTETKDRAVLAHNQRGRMMDEDCIYIEDEHPYSGLLEEE